MFPRSIGRAVITATVAGLLALASVTAVAQRHSSPSNDVPVVMLSDLHFDPLHDPDKVPLLSSASVSQWATILTTPSKPGLEDRFATIQKSCKSKEAADTPYALLRSSLSAANAKAPSASFVVVSGDLLVHDLDCRYRVSMGQPESTADDQSASAAFAEKTTIFVMQQIESTFQELPVYFAMGNNDSRCNHNRLDFHDEYLKSSAGTLLQGLRGVSSEERAKARTSFESVGYYAVTMPAPMRRTRLIVINDIYMMPKYTNCEADAHDHRGEQAQITWLNSELSKARSTNQQVWVLGHLPPIVNADSSLSPAGSFCSTGKAVRFQATDELANLLIAYADVVKLGIFGHTHMDEIHMLRGDGVAVPIKVVASITPVSGNLPSFTVGSIDPATAALRDFIVYEASNATGLETHWDEEYAFDKAYHEPNASPASIAELIGRLRADTNGTSAESREYQAHFLKGAGGKKLSPSWQGYVCSLDNASAEDFRNCVCRNESHSTAR